VFYNTTIVMRIVGDFWSRLDPRLVQAAEVLGASPWQSLRRISLPLLMPAILAASLLVFLFDFTSFGVILVLGGPRFATLETEIYYQTTALFNLPLAATLALVQLALTLLITLSYSRLSARLSRPLSLRPQNYALRRLDTWPRRIFAGTIIGILLVLMLLPLVALTLGSFNPFPGRPDAGWSFAFYQELFTSQRTSIFFIPPGSAIAISLGYAVITVLLSLALGLPAAWALSHDGDSAPSRWLDPLLMLPLGTSAVTLGLGFLVALDQPPLDLRASPLLVPLAHTLVAFPFVVRALTPALRSIRPRLRHAAAVLGANPRRTLLAVDLPLAGRAVLAAGVFAFTISLGEFGATSLIARPEYPTLPLAIYRLLSRPGLMNYGQALALSAILMTVTALCMLLLERVRLGQAGEF
jgi:thiamine transport system permease protein